MNSGPNQPQAERLRLGRELSTWPALKVRRAEQLSAELSAAINLWLYAANLRLESRLESDPRSAFLELRIDEPPAISQWSLIFGDFIHNLRSALDAVTWELANYADTPSRPRQIFFPILTDGKKWKEQERFLTTIPKVILARIEELQPYNDPKEPEGSLLAVLAALDNLDKHRQSIEILPRTNGVPRVEVLFQDPIRAGSMQPRYLADAPLRDKTKIILVKATQPIRELVHEQMPSLTIRVNLENRSFELQDLLRNLVIEVQGVISHVTTAEAERVGSQ